MGASAELFIQMQDEQTQEENDKPERIYNRKHYCKST